MADFGILRCSPNMTSSKYSLFIYHWKAYSMQIQNQIGSETRNVPQGTLWGPCFDNGGWSIVDFRSYTYDVIQI